MAGRCDIHSIGPLMAGSDTKRGHNLMKTVLGITLVLALAVSGLAQTQPDALAEPAHPIESVWTKSQPVANLVGGTVSIDMVAKTFSFTWKNRGLVQYSISDVKEDSETGMPRYTLTLRGTAGIMTVTVLAFSPTTIYIGQTPLGGIAIWGAYTRKPS